MKTEQENTKKTSEVYTDPQTNKTVVQSIGIKPTASPIDFAVGGIGALYSGGTKLLGAFTDLANPIPMPGIRTLAYKVDNYLPASIDKFIKPRVTLSGKELTGTFMNNKTRLAAGAENAVYRYGSDKVVKIRNFDNPTKDIAGIKQSNRLISELGGPNTRIAAYYRHPTQKTLQPILKQDFVEGVDPTAAEIKNFVLSKGMRPVGDISGDAYFYKNYTIADLHSKNLIKDKSGILRPIDLYSMKGIPK